MNSIFIEETLINSVKSLLAWTVNDILAESELSIPLIECPALNTAGGYSVTVPAVRLTAGERTEKDRIIRLDAYTLTVTFSLPGQDGERNCYAYAGAVEKALNMNPTLDGVADRAVLVKKEYKAPKHAGTGEGWEAVLTVRVTVEGRL
jgi:hypothetical protein